MICEYYADNKISLNGQNMPILPVIQDIAIVARSDFGDTPSGEAIGEHHAALIAHLEKAGKFDGALKRIEISIIQLMDYAKMLHERHVHRFTAGSFVTRLSTNEFFFYTKEPLTLAEFQELLESIVNHAKTRPTALQCILGSFAVKTEDNKLMNVTPYLTCGDHADVHLIVKNHTAEEDVRYKVKNPLVKSSETKELSDETEELDAGKLSGTVATLAFFDCLTHVISPMPSIMINGKPKIFDFNTIVQCKTPDGSCYLTAIEICYDHFHRVAFNNYLTLRARDVSIKAQPISHLVISNSIELIDKACLGDKVMHVDPEHSRRGCKDKVSQEQGANLRLEFPLLDTLCSYVVEPTALSCFMGEDHASFQKREYMSSETPRFFSSAATPLARSLEAESEALLRALGCLYH